MQCRRLREEWFYAVLVSSKIQGRSNIFSLMVLPHWPSVIKEADDNRRRYFQVRQPQAKEKRRNSTTRAPISLEQSHSPQSSPCPPKTPFLVKQSCQLCMWLCHSDASGKQVCVEYHGAPNATPSPSPFTSKAQPWMLAAASGLKMKRLCCSPLIQKNCHSLHSIGRR